MSSAAKSREGTGFYLDDAGASSSSFLVVQLVHRVFFLKGLNTGCYNVDVLQTLQNLSFLLYPAVSVLNAEQTGPVKSIWEADIKATAAWGSRLLCLVKPNT